MCLFYSNNVLAHLINKVSAVEECLESLLIDVQIILKAEEIRKQIPKPLIKAMPENSIYLRKALIKPEFYKAFVIDSQCVKNWRKNSK